jgi:hypothetical protein
MLTTAIKILGVKTLRIILKNQPRGTQKFSPQRGRRFLRLIPPPNFPIDADPQKSVF